MCMVGSGNLEIEISGNQSAIVILVSTEKG